MAVRAGLPALLALLIVAGASCREASERVPGAGALPVPDAEVLRPDPGEPTAAPAPAEVRGDGSDHSAPPPGETAGDPAALEQTDRGAGEGTPISPVPRPDRIRGLYLNAWVAGSAARSAALLDLAERTEVNTFVIDVKDASGYVSYSTRTELAREVGADGEIRIGNVRSLLERLRDAGVYPVARIVVFKDPRLAAARPDLAVQDSAGGVWIDGAGDAWVNPFDETVWDYHVQLAREAADLGFPEIQWDYVRFPDRPASEMAAAVFPGGADRVRSKAIRAFLEHARAELADLHVELTADVFGVTTTFRHDVGIGQVWEDIVDVVDAILPMVYPSHYWEGSYGLEEPNAYPYEVVSAALRDAVQRSSEVEGAGALIPWLQDFTLGQPRYGPAEVRAQIQAAYDAGVEEWILWNASGRYSEDALLPVSQRGAVAEVATPDPLIRIGGRLVPASRRWDPPTGPDGEDPSPGPFGMK